MWNHLSWKSVGHTVLWNLLAVISGGRELGLGVGRTFWLKTAIPATATEELLVLGGIPFGMQ